MQRLSLASCCLFVLACSPAAPIAPTPLDPVIPDPPAPPAPPPEETPTVPTAPTGLTITGGDATLTLTWSAVGGATSYNVYYRASAGVTAANGTKLSNATSGSAVTGLDNGVTYYVAVSAVNAVGESALSSEASGTPQVAAPAAPTGLMITAGDAQVSLSWNASAGATSYNIYYGDAPNVTAANGTQQSATDTFAVIAPLTNGVSHYFVVTAVNAGGESGASTEVGATPQVPAPGAPTGVSLVAGDGEVTVSWNAVSGATSYNLYYGAAPGVTSANGTEITNAISGAPLAASNGATVYVVVTAVNAGGESAISAEVSGTPAFELPVAPSDVTIGFGDEEAVLSWTAVANATSYNIYYATSPGVTSATGTKVADATSGIPTGGLVNGTTYYFIVTAVNPTGESPASSEVSTTPLLLVGGTLQGRTLALTGTRTTFAGNCQYLTMPAFADGPAADARFYQPNGITTDGIYFYVADSGNHVIRRLDRVTGETTTIAGTAGAPGSANGQGTSASFNFPTGIVTNGASLFVADSGNYTIRAIDLTTYEVTTLAGVAGESDITDGQGSAARFMNPYALTTDNSVLYVSDNQATKMRRIQINNADVTSVTLSPAPMYGVTIYATDGTTLYGTNGTGVYSIHKSTGAVTLIAGSDTAQGNLDAQGPNARFNIVSGLVTDGVSLYATDINNNNIRKIVIFTGDVTTVSSTGWLWPRMLTSDGFSLFVAQQDFSCISKIE